VKEFSIVGVLIINAFILVRYCYLIIRGRIQPALAMWLFFSIAAGGSLATYLSSGNFGLLDNIVNSADILLVVVITLAIAVFGDKSTKFNVFDSGCLVSVVVICVFWAVTKNHIASHLLIQTIMIIAYFPVVKRLWTTDRNTESYVAWIGLLLAPSVSLLSSRGMLASVYAIRAMVCTSLLLLLMIRADLRNRRAGKAPTES
jgi:hypothetical protein